MVSVIFVSLLGLLFPAAAVATLVAVIAARRQDGDDPDEGVATAARRLFLYGLGAIALAIATAGVALLVMGALDAAAGAAVVTDDRRRLARALAFATVGIPAWAILMLAAQRAMRRDPDEARSQARRWYFTVVRGLTLVIATFNFVEAGRWIIGVTEFSGSPWGWLFATGAVWVLHDRLAASEPPVTVTARLLDRLYGYYGAFVGLVFLMVGATWVIAVPLSAAYDGAFREAFLAGDWDERWREGWLLVVAGLGVWGWHWLRTLAHGDRGSTLWRIMVFLAGVLAGALITVVSTGSALYLLLQWLIGEPESKRAADHFAMLPGLCAAVLVGLGSWSYHRVVLMERAQEARSEPERIYRYVLAAAGLVAVASGVSAMLALTVEVLSGESADLFASAGWWRNPLVTAITLLLVGAPLWGYSWWRTQQAVAAGGRPERVATSRRVYLFGTFGIAALFVLVDLTIVLYRVFEASLSSDVSRGLLRDMRWNLALVLTAGAISVYHWLVLREDQAARGEEPHAEIPAPRREVTLIVADADREVLRRALASVPGVTLAVWTRGDAAPGATSIGDVDALRAALSESPGGRFVVLAEGGAYRLVPVRA